MTCRASRTVSEWRRPCSRRLIATRAVRCNCLNRRHERMRANRGRSIGGRHCGHRRRVPAAPTSGSRRAGRRQRTEHSTPVLPPSDSSPGLDTCATLLVLLFLGLITQARPEAIDVDQYDSCLSCRLPASAAGRVADGTLQARRQTGERHNLQPRSLAGGRFGQADRRTYAWLPRNPLQPHCRGQSRGLVPRRMEKADSA